MDTSTAVGAAKPVSLVTSPSKALDLNLADAHKTLGNGPMRFALIGERSVKEQVDALDATERGCFDTLKKNWEEKHPDSPFADEIYLRFARCSPGAKKFNEKSAFKVMQKFDKRFLSLVAAGLGIQLMSKVGAWVSVTVSRLLYCDQYRRPRTNTLPSKSTDSLSDPWTKDT
jgi:hypothetical protein